MDSHLPKRKKILYSVIAVVIAVVFLFPIYWLVQLSFKPDMEAFGRVLTYYPHQFTFYPWMENLDDPVFMTSLMNSFINGFLTMGITLLLGVPAAYGMGRYKVRGTSTFLLTFLISQMLPASLTLTPLYLIFNSVGLLGKHITSPIAIAAILHHHAEALLPLGAGDAGRGSAAGRLRAGPGLLLCDDPGGQNGHHHHHRHFLPERMERPGLFHDLQRGGQHAPADCEHL